MHDSLMVTNVVAVITIGILYLYRTIYTRLCGCTYTEYTPVTIVGYNYVAFAFNNNACIVTGHWKFNIQPTQNGYGDEEANHTTWRSITVFHLYTCMNVLMLFVHSTISPFSISLKYVKHKMTSCMSFLECIWFSANASFP